MSLGFAHRDPEFEAWYAGDITTLELADQWLPSMLLVDEEDASEIDALAWAWRYLGDELTAIGFEADDFATFLDHVVPRLPRSAFVPPPDLATDLTAPRRPSPVARVYLDVDCAFSPLCPQRDESDLIKEMRGPRLAVGAPPETGWTWHMTTLGLGPTPIPVELAHSIVALDKTDVEVVWMTSWHERANWLLEAVGIDDVLRSTDWDSTMTVMDLKWMIVAAETERDGVPFVWIDDAEITPQTWRWASSLDVPNLLIRPNEYHGLTPSSWDNAVRWLQDVTTSDLGSIARSVPHTTST